jgi:hypothetical protein
MSERGIQLQYFASEMEFYTFMKGPKTGRQYRIEGRNGHRGYYDFWVHSDWSPPQQSICPKNPDNWIMLQGYYPFSLGLQAARSYIRMLDNLEWRRTERRRSGMRK